MPNPSHDPPVSSKAPHQDLMDRNVLCTFKIKIESQNSKHRVYQRPVTISKSRSKYQTPVRNLHHPNQDKIPHFSQEHPVSSKRPYHDLKDMVVFMSSKSRSRAKTAARNLPNPPNPQSPQIGLKGHGYSF